MIETLVTDPSRLRLGGVRCELTIFFSDIAGFTTISERLTPEELVHVLNRYLTDMTFRAIPEARTIEEEMAAEPWYSVGADDVFPEEFRRFLFGKPEIKLIFNRLHGELFDPSYWKELQSAISNGQVVDVFPYRRKKRFIHH